MGKIAGCSALSHSFPFIFLSVLFSLSPNQTGFKWCSGPGPFHWTTFCLRFRQKSGLWWGCLPSKQIHPVAKRLEALHGTHISIKPCPVKLVDLTHFVLHRSQEPITGHPTGFMWHAIHWSYFMRRFVVVFLLCPSLTLLGGFGRRTGLTQVWLWLWPWLWLVQTW